MSTTTRAGAFGRRYMLEKSRLPAPKESKDDPVRLLFQAVYDLRVQQFEVIKLKREIAIRKKLLEHRDATLNGEESDVDTVFLKRMLRALRTWHPNPVDSLFKKR